MPSQNDGKMEIELHIRYIFNMSQPGGSLFNNLITNIASILPYTPRKQSLDVLSGQSYKASTIVIYASRVAHDLKIPHITTLES